MSMSISGQVQRVLWTMAGLQLLATAGSVSVQRIRLPLDQELTLIVNSSVEYIVELWPTGEQASSPIRLRAELDSAPPGGAAVLLTARRGAVGDTWQVPAPVDDGGPASLAVQRTLCPEDAGGASAGGCEGGETRWAVHVSAACGAELRLRATAGEWLLQRGEGHPVAVAREEPALRLYRWGDERGVRLLLDGEGRECTVVAVMEYRCPLPQSVSALPPRAKRLTMVRSAALYVERSAYPEGFVVALLARESAACGLPEPERPVWLWRAAVTAATATERPPTRATERDSVTVTVREALPRSGYALPCGLTLALLAIAYAAVGGLALASRRGWPPRPVAEPAGDRLREGEAGDPESAGPRLRLAALCRKPPAALADRSRRFLHTLALVAVFYALPVVQLVAAFQLVLNVSGELDLCYYNGRCAHPAPPLSDLNHVFSNAGYVLLGALFVLQVQCGGERVDRLERGVPVQRGLLAALGCGLVTLGTLSASYHVCPNRLNFQFDSAFMFVLAVLLMVWMYGARHPDLNAPAHAAFGVLAALMALVVGGVLGAGASFWAVWSALHVAAVLALSLRVYYGGSFRLASWPRAVLTTPRRPRHAPMLAMLLVANAANWALAVYGLVTQPGDFAGHLLTVLLANAFLHLLWYLANKLWLGERPSPAAWALLGAAAACWPAALYFFLWSASDWSSPPALSRHYNHECLLLGFYDSHDLWHLLSAFALYFTFNALRVLDDDLAHVPREHIAVF